VGGVAALAVAVALATSPAQFLHAHAANGAFAEPGGVADPSLTAWAVLGLRAAGSSAPGSLAYLQSQESTLVSTTDVALVVLAERSLGAPSPGLLARLATAEHPNGRIGETVNSTIWAVLALGRSPAATTRFVLARQARNGGFAWNAGGQPDSNDTAAALELFRVAHVTGAPVARAVSFLLGFRRPDGGFELANGRGSDAQSTAWAIQGLVAAGRAPPRSAFAYLARLKRADGSYRYSTQYDTTPVWVTAQVLAALAKRPFPF
jgi:Prenyltransferase and squalene oxidase repeat